MIIIYISEYLADAYIAQGWQAWRLTSHHGARPPHMKTFMAMIEI